MGTHVMRMLGKLIGFRIRSSISSVSPKLLMLCMIWISAHDERILLDRCAMRPRGCIRQLMNPRSDRLGPRGRGPLYLICSRGVTSAIDSTVPQLALNTRPVIFVHHCCIASYTIRIRILDPQLPFESSSRLPKCHHGQQQQLEQNLGSGQVGSTHALQTWLSLSMSQSHT